MLATSVKGSGGRPDERDAEEPDQSTGVSDETIARWAASVIN
ncbi:MAG TPA: hypothetical protein PKD61_21060 [Polyangiaceae bacterium]|nr:hypothetical protein [Polyangiaceae bacterium]